jgi:vancomycin permeability regulator SanA
MKFLVISFDEQAHKYVTNNTTMISYLMAAGIAGQKVTTDPTKFRDKQFNLITARKKGELLEI